MSYTITNNIMYVRDDTGELVPVSMIASGASAKDTVLYTMQSLTAEQQAQARENIAAAGVETVNELKGDINSIINTEVVISKNLYNPNDADYMAGYRCSATTGNPSADSAWNLTGWISLAEGETVTISRGGGSAMENSTAITRIYAYTSDKSFISATYNTGLTYYTAPINCAYIRCAVSSLAAFKQHQIEYGTQMTSYEPYSLTYKVITPKEAFVNQIKASEIDNDADFITASELKNTPNIIAKALALPSVIYGFVGVPMRIYPYNIMQYAPSDVYIRYKSSNNGGIFSDRWEYIPEQAKDFNLDTLVFDHSLRQLNSHLSAVIIKDSSVKQSLTVMVIGDSTVQASTETQKMLDLASADNYPLTLLGTRGTAPNLTEGRGGWTTTMFAHSASNPSGTVINAFYNPSTELFDFAYYMGQQGYTGVDCVFIQLGINDLFSAKTSAELETAIENYLSDMDIIVNSIHDYDPDIMIVINTVFPSDTNQDAFELSYHMVQTVWQYRQNVYQGNIALLDHYKNMTNVYVSWFGASINVAENMGGDVHPVADGYNQLGTQMYAVVRAVN